MIDNGPKVISSPQSRRMGVEIGTGRRLAEATLGPGKTLVFKLKVFSGGQQQISVREWGISQKGTMRAAHKPYSFPLTDFPNIWIGSISSRFGALRLAGRDRWVKFPVEYLPCVVNAWEIVIDRMRASNA